MPLPRLVCPNGHLVADVQVVRVCEVCGSPLLVFATPVYPSPVAYPDGDITVNGANVTRDIGRL